MQMDNNLFSDSILQLMSQPDRWTMVSSWFTPDINHSAQPHHSAWMMDNSHSHPHREFLMTLDGGGWQGFRGKVYPRHPGSIFFFDAFETHDFFAPVWTPDEDQLWISLLPQHIAICIYSFRDGKIDTRRECRHIFTSDELGLSESALLMLKPGTTTTSAGLIRLHLTSFIGLLLSAIIHTGYLVNINRDETEGLQRRTVQAIQHHIEATAGNGVSLDSLVQLTGYSKFHFMRLFKQHTGLSIHTYIDQCRHQRVLEMRDAGNSQKEISYSLGFSCPAAFCHWLHRYKKKEDF
jgi:AraC-like DNA-binding protein